MNAYYFYCINLIGAFMNPQSDHSERPFPYSLQFINFELADVCKAILRKNLYHLNIVLFMLLNYNELIYNELPYSINESYYYFISYE